MTIRRPSVLPCLLLWLQEFLTLPKDSVDGLRWAGVQTEPAAFQAAGWIKLIGRGRKPRAGWANRDADRLVCAAVGVADEVIANDQHGFDSFKEALREDLEHILIR